MPDYTKEEYLGAIFKLKVMAMNKESIKRLYSFNRSINLGLCNTNLLNQINRFRSKFHFCPLDLDKNASNESLGGCYSRCAYYTYRFSNEQIHKLIEDFEIKD